MHLSNVGDVGAGVSPKPGEEKRRSDPSVGPERLRHPQYFITNEP